MAALAIDVLDPHLCELGEGPCWNAATGEISWVDILGCAIHVLEPATGTRRTIATPSMVGAAVPRTAGGWLAGLEDGPALLDADGAVTPFTTFVEADGASQAVPMRSNDGKCDSRGRCWLGTMPVDAATVGTGSLYRIDPGERTPVPMLRDVTISNGIGWSPDDRTMVYIDTTTGRVDAFDFDADAGTLSNRRPLVVVDGTPGLPDGLAVDADGCIWVALWDGASVRRYAPDGRLLTTLELPCSRVTSCAFVGARLESLVLTTAHAPEGQTEPLAGATFIADVGVAGLPVMAFGG